MTDLVTRARGLSREHLYGQLVHELADKVEEQELELKMLRISVQQVDAKWSLFREAMDNAMHKMPCGKMDWHMCEPCACRTVARVIEDEPGRDEQTTASAFFAHKEEHPEPTEELTPLQKRMQSGGA